MPRTRKTDEIKEEVKAVEAKVKKVPAKAKAAAKKVEDKVAAEKIEAKKTAARATRAIKAAADKAETAVKKPAAKAKAVKLEIYVQSPMGGNITPEEIAAKLPRGVESVFVRVDQNKLYWVKGEETGSVDIW